MGMKKEIIVPASPQELPMERFQHFHTMSEEDRFDFVKLFACLTGCTLEEAEAVKAQDVQRAMVALISSISDTKCDLIHKWENKGITYGFEPQLDEISFGMMADVCTALETPETWHKVLAILYRPIIREHKSFDGMYAIESHDSRSNDYIRRQAIFKDAPSSLFISVRAFFLRGSMDLNKHIQVSLTPKTERLMEKVKRKLNLSVTDTDGSRTFTY